MRQIRQATGNQISRYRNFPSVILREGRGGIHDFSPPWAKTGAVGTNQPMQALRAAVKVGNHRKIVALDPTKQDGAIAFALCIGDNRCQFEGRIDLALDHVYLVLGDKLIEEASRVHALSL